MTAAAHRSHAVDATCGSRVVSRVSWSADNSRSPGQTQICQNTEQRGLCSMQHKLPCTLLVLRYADAGSAGQQCMKCLFAVFEEEHQFLVVTRSRSRSRFSCRAPESTSIGKVCQLFGKVIAVGQPPSCIYKNRLGLYTCNQKSLRWRLLLQLSCRDSLEQTRA